MDEFIFNGVFFLGPNEFIEIENKKVMAYNFGQAYMKLATELSSQVKMEKYVLYRQLKKSKTVHVRKSKQY